MIYEVYYNNVAKVCVFYEGKLVRLIRIYKNSRKYIDIVYAKISSHFSYPSQQMLHLLKSQFIGHLSLS